MERLDADRCACIQDVNLPDEVMEDLERERGLDKILSHLPDEKVIENFNQITKALSDRYRTTIMMVLCRSRMCPCLLKEITALGDSKLSYHLNILEGTGLVISERVKNWRVFDLTPLGREVMERMAPILEAVR